MTRPTWIGMEQPESSPKDFDTLQEEFMRSHWPLLWCVMEVVEREKREEE